jgi:hypothetical protein
MMRQLETDVAGRSMPEPISFDTWPHVSRIETDRFCFQCGYNLHHQAVRREPSTEVLMSRCPECGTFSPMAVPATEFQSWLQRFKGLLVIVWVCILLAIAFMAGFLHAVAIYFTLDSLTNYWDPSTMTRVHDVNPVYLEHPRFWWPVYGTSGASSFGLAFVWTIMAMFFLPHWRKAAHVAVVLVWALLPALIVGLFFRWEVVLFGSPHLVSWSVPYILAYVACYLAGGVMALLIGQRLVWLVMRICVPPRWRVYLAAISPAGGRSPR